MYQLITGEPGSGKSYYMVNYLKKYFSYDTFYEDFTVKDNFLLISNIDGLRVPHLDLVQLIGDPLAGIDGKYAITDFFTVENFEKLMNIKRVKNIIILIDEANKYFDSKFYDKSVMYFFQYHRHLGVDILMGVHNPANLPRQFISLVSNIVEARPRTKSVAGAFSYHFKDTSGNYLYSKTLRKNKETFRAYKSFTFDEASKPKNAFVHWIIIGSVFMIIGGSLLYGAISKLKGKGESHPEVKAAPVQHLSVFKPVSSARLPDLPPVVAAGVPAPVVSSLRDFFPPDSVSAPRSPLPQQKYSSSYSVVSNSAVPQDAVEKHLNTQKALSVFYVWRLADGSSGTTDDEGKVPPGATFKRYRATW